MCKSIEPVPAFAVASARWVCPHPDLEDRTAGSFSSDGDSPEGVQSMWQEPRCISGVCAFEHGILNIGISINAQACCSGVH